VIITWDNAKRLANLEKHGLNFADLDLDFFLNSLIVPAQGRRFKAIGHLRPEVVIAVIFAPVGSEAVAVVSMRLASRKEGIMFHDR
jgi:uncharacterized protein